MKIIKRNGSEVAFDITKIIVAITKANEDVDEADVYKRQVYPDPTTEVLSQRFYRTFSKIGSTVYKREQNTVDCQVPIGVLLHLGNQMCIRDRSL